MLEWQILLPNILSCRRFYVNRSRLMKQRKAFALSSALGSGRDRRDRRKGRYINSTSSPGVYFVTIKPQDQKRKAGSFLTLP
jgi:hypothetical protein